MITVMVVDDEALLRGALAALLELGHDISVVAQAENGTDAIALAAEHRPDVVLLDLEMPGIDGIETAMGILGECPEQAIVMLTRHGRPGVLKRALRAGVRGFVAKSIEPDELADVVERIHGGGRYIDAEISTAAMIDDSPLTDREVDVLRLTDGRTVREISHELHLAQGTVRNYLSSAMHKLGAATRYEAARVARARDWL